MLSFDSRSVDVSTPNTLPDWEWETAVAGHHRSCNLPTYWPVRLALTLHQGVQIYGAPKSLQEFSDCITHHAG